MNTEADSGRAAQEPRSRAATDPRATVAAMWRTRPSRRQDDRKIAGVAAALARRYDIDPVLVRIALVVSAFYGVGLVLYLLVWVALPADPADPPTGWFGAANRALNLVVLAAAVVAVVATTGSVLSGRPGALVGVVVLGGLLYLLHVNRGERGLAASPGSPDEPTPTPSAITSSTAPSSVARPGSPTAPGSTGSGPTSTGSAGSAGGSSARRRRRSALTTAVIGLALLAGGVTGAVALAGHGLGGLQLILGAMLAVVGLGLLVGAFRHTGRGLIAVALPLVLLGWLVTARPLPAWHGVGELRVRPTTFGELAPGYRRTFGEITLDLRGLDVGTAPRPGAAPASATPPAPIPVPTPTAGPAPTPGPAPTATPGPSTTPTPTEIRTEVRLNAGQATVLLPPDLPVRVHCHADAGDVHCLGGGGHASGPTSDIRVRDPGVGTPPGAPVLDLEVVVGAGDVEVTRG